MARVWLVTVGEPLPSDIGGQRLLRSGILADLLVRQGDEVVFWTSSFDHTNKKQRADSDMVIPLNDCHQIRLLYSRGYLSNISLDRLRNHRELASKFREQAPGMPRPDVILCSLPTLELCQAAVEYGRANGVPVVLDIRDLWPDLFVELVPKILRPIARLGLTPMFRMAKRVCTEATALTGLTSDYVNWALNYASRPPGAWDKPFPMAYADTTPEATALDVAREYWQQQGLSENEFIVCWFGTMLGRHFEFETVLAAADRLARDGRKIRFVLCGAGADLEKYRRLGQSVPQVLFPGWMNAAQIWTLSRISSVGLAPYISCDNFVRNLPNKPIEYLSAGLPVASSLRGVLERLLATHDCGMTYENRNPGQLAQVIADMQDNPARRAVMSENARQLYRKQFVAEAVYSEMRTYLHEVAESHSHQHAKARAA